MLTPTENPKWFELSTPPAVEDFTKEALAAVADEKNWLENFVQLTDEEVLKNIFKENNDFFLILKKEASLTKYLPDEFDASYLDNLFKSVEPSLKSLILEKLREQLGRELLRHVGPQATYDDKASLISQLKILYAVIAEKCKYPFKDPKAEKFGLQLSLFTNALLACTSGFHSRSEITSRLLHETISPPKTIAAFQQKIRNALVKNVFDCYKIKLAANANNKIWLESNEIHLFNESYRLANELNYGVAKIVEKDPYTLPQQYSSEIQGMLNTIFLHDNTLFANFLSLQAHIKDALSLFDYTGRKKAGSYTSIEYSSFMGFLNELLGLTIKDPCEYMLVEGEELRLVDIDWPGLSRRLWLKLEQDGYFIRAKDTSSPHAQFLAFIPSPDEAEDPEEAAWWTKNYNADLHGIPKKLAARIASSYPLFMGSEDFVRCINFFHLDEAAQKKIWLAFIFTHAQKKQAGFSFFMDNLLRGVLKNNWSNNFISLLRKHPLTKTWYPDFNWHWQEALDRRDVAPFKKLLEVDWDNAGSKWKQQKEIAPKELLAMLPLSPNKQHEELLTLAIKNFTFNRINANYLVLGNTFLHLAVKTKNLLSVKLMLALGVDIYASNSESKTVFDLCDDPKIKNLLDNRAIELELRKKLEKVELEDSDVPAIIFLYMNCLQLKIGDDSLLITAARHGRSDSVKKLIAAGASYNCANFSGEKPLLLAAEQGNLEIVKTLLSLYPSLPSDDETGDIILCLKRAVIHGQVGIVSFLYEKYRDELFSEEVLNSDYDSLLVQAVKKNNIEMINLIIEIAKSIDKQNSIINYEVDENTVLSIAAKEGNVAAVEILLAAGAEDYYEGNQCKTPALVEAAQTNQLEVFKKLLAHAVYIPETFTIKNEEEDEDGTEEEFPSPFKELIGEARARHTQIFAAIERGEEIDVSNLPVNLRNSEGCSLFSLAVQKNCREVVTSLLKKGAEYNPSDLQSALENNNYPLVKEFLLQELTLHPASYQNKSYFVKGQSVLEYILASAEIDGLKFLIEICEKNPRCWKSIFGSVFLLEGNKLYCDDSLARLIALGNTNVRVAKALFTNKLVYSVKLKDRQNAVPLQELLASSSEGQKILRLLQAPTAPTAKVASWLSPRKIKPKKYPLAKPAGIAKTSSALVLGRLSQPKVQESKATAKNEMDAPTKSVDETVLARKRDRDQEPEAAPSQEPGKKSCLRLFTRKPQIKERNRPSKAIVARGFLSAGRKETAPNLSRSRQPKRERDEELAQEATAASTSSQG